MPRWEVWSINGCVVDAVFPCLEELHITKCPKLVKVSLEALPSLKDLIIDDCGDVLLKSLVCVASSVTKLSIYGISGLSDEVWGGVVQYLGAVEDLEIAKCNEIRNLWESKEVEACKEVLVNLNKLEINCCEKLERIGRGDKEEEEEGSNLPISLRMLEIWGCKNLKHLSCPGSIEILNIWSCNNVEHLSCPANSIQELDICDCSSITCVSFPTQGAGGGWQKLKSLEISGCNSVLEKEMEKHVLVNDTNMMPMMMLEAVGIRDGWQDLKSITKFTTCFMRLEIEGCEGIELFPNLQDVNSLKHLEIRNCTSMDGPPMSGGGGVSVGVWPPKLESLCIGHLKRPISEWGPLPTSSSTLVKLTLWGGFGSSSSSSSEEEEDVKSFPTSSLLLPPSSSSSSSSLTRLELWDFKKMERISSSEGLQHLTSLQHLEIWNCPMLKHLPETLLPSLLSLEIGAGINEELKEKMMRRSGSYWPLLSDIPYVYIE